MEEQVLSIDVEKHRNFVNFIFFKNNLKIQKIYAKINTINKATKYFRVRIALDILENRRPKKQIRIVAAILWKLTGKRKVI